MMVSSVERDTETIIDRVLAHLGWDDGPRSKNRNVWKQTASTNTQKKVVGRQET